MWVLTSFGAFMPALRHKEDVAPGDERQLQVRARRERDLLRLKTLYMPDMGKIVRNAGTDYEVRIYCTHTEWADVMQRMSMDIDYASFKNTTDRWKDDQLHTAYLRVWSTLYSVLGTRKAFDYTPRKRGKKGKRGGQSRLHDAYEQVSYDDPRNWWDEVPSIAEELNWK